MRIEPTPCGRTRSGPGGPVDRYDLDSPVRLQRRTRHPLADIEALVRPPVLITNVATLLVGFGMFGSFILIPQLAETPEATGYGFGLDATGAGLLLLPGSLVMLLAGPVSGALGARFGSKLPLALGGIVAAAGLLMLGLDHGSQGAVLGWAILMSTGIGLAFSAMPNLIVGAVPATQTGEAIGFNALVRSVGASRSGRRSARRCWRGAPSPGAPCRPTTATRPRS
jgi:hypothetical protein